MNILDSLVDGALAMTSRKDSDAVIGAIVRCLRTGEEPDRLTGNALAMWTAIAPVVRKSRARSVAGAEGGNASACRCRDAVEPERSGETDSKQPSKVQSKTASKRASKMASEQVSSLPSPDFSSPLQFPFGVEGCGEEGPEPPDEDEVRLYFAANCLIGDPGEFFDHFEAQGWVRGNGRPIADWRAAARQWARRQREFDQSKPPELRAPVERLPVAENRRDFDAELAEVEAQIAAMGGGEDR